MRVRIPFLNTVDKSSRYGIKDQAAALVSLRACATDSTVVLVERPLLKPDWIKEVFHWEEFWDLFQDCSLNGLHVKFRQVNLSERGK